MLRSPAIFKSGFLARRDGDASINDVDAYPLAYGEAGLTQPVATQAQVRNRGWWSAMASFVDVEAIANGELAACGEDTNSSSHDGLLAVR